MKCYVIIYIAALLVPLISAGYFNGIAPTNSPKRATKYLKFLKNSSHLLGSGSTTSARYIQSPTHHAHFQSPSDSRIYPHQVSTHHYQYHHSGSRAQRESGMMTSASERTPSRIIIVRQPSGSSKKAHHSSQTYSAVQYMPKTSTAGPVVVYPSYDAYPAYSYAPRPLSAYGYQMPQMQMAATSYIPQIAAASPYSPSGHLSQSHTSPLVASMIAAAQRVTQGQAAQAYGGQYGAAASYMMPQYSPYGYGAATAHLYPGYGYAG
ncbi:hypothetical protein BIW11_12483 [Tropilaelaps mercedesae]|uniref:Uncharacterized protein n=1 Tax=Tropilaelaps mercedesae TaxID=418985 RepID=A0A1V9X667_9ACAR|nr:hypothetical protein BIW11_12483 [Tropilaelaps mercedesae]